MSDNHASSKEEKDVLKIVADQHGSPTWAGDIATSLLELIKQWADGEAIRWGTYHYSGQPAISWKGFAEAIFEQAVELGVIGKRPTIDPITTSEYPTLARRPINSVLDCRKLAQQSNIGQADWHSGLKNTLESIARSH